MILEALQFGGILHLFSVSKFLMRKHCLKSYLILGSSDDCIEYHHVLYKDQFYSISPLVVFSHQVGIVFHTPASYVGQALGSFTSGILRKGLCKRLRMHKIIIF